MDSQTITYREALNQAMSEEMERDETIINRIPSDGLEIKEILTTSSTVSHVSTQGNDNSGVSVTLEDVATAETQRDETITTITPLATQIVTNGLTSESTELMGGEPAGRVKMDEMGFADSGVIPELFGGVVMS